MRQATTRHVPAYAETQSRGTGFVLGAVFCAAVLTAILALHGGPNLLGDRFNMDIVATQP